MDKSKDLRRKRETEEEDDIPWFLHSSVNPPTDSLTIGLLALVEDLPSIPGPKPVGPENDSRIFGAFKKRGWTGFKEEFDRIVPRDRADYADVKRDLLCEPLFNIKAYRNMADAVSCALFLASNKSRMKRSQRWMAKTFANGGWCGSNCSLGPVQKHHPASPRVNRSVARARSNEGLNGVPQGCFGPELKPTSPQKERQ